MAKARKPLALLGNRVALKPEAPPEMEPAGAAVPMVAAAAGGGIGSRQANRENKKAVTTYVSPMVWGAIRNLAVDQSNRRKERITSQVLMEEAIALLFQNYGVPMPIDD